MNSNVYLLKNTNSHYLLLNTTIIPLCNGKISLILLWGWFIFSSTFHNFETSFAAKGHLKIPTVTIVTIIVWSQKHGIILKKAKLKLFFLKFYFFHQMIGLQKLWKMFFILSKKFFSFSRYSYFCNFLPSFSHFPDMKGQLEVE